MLYSVPTMKNTKVNPTNTQPSGGVIGNVNSVKDPVNSVIVGGYQIAGNGTVTKNQPSISDK